MKSALISPLLAGLLLLTGCAQPAARAGGGGGGTIDAINHTKWAVNHFSVNGQSGIDSIGPFQGGGGGCCFSVPARWTPGMTVRVDWETGGGTPWTFRGIRIGKNTLPGKKELMPKRGSTAKPSRCPTITAKRCAVLRCTFYPAMM